MRVESFLNGEGRELRGEWRDERGECRPAEGEMEERAEQREADLEARRVEAIRSICVEYARRRSPLVLLWE